MRETHDKLRALAGVSLRLADDFNYAVHALISTHRNPEQTEKYIKRIDSILLAIAVVAEDAKHFTGELK